MYGKNYIKINTYNISVFIFSLLPILIVTGPALPDLVLLILIVIFFSQKVKIEKKIYFYYFLLFYIYLNIRSLFSTDIIFSLKNNIPYFRFGFLIIVTSFLFKNLDFFFKILLYFLTIL